MPLPKEPPADDRAEKWIAVAKQSELTAGSVIEVVAGETILVLTNVDGQIYALDGMCAHQGGPLGKGKLDGCTLTCPWHGWQYDIRTGKQLLSRTIRQHRYAIRLHSDTILVDVGSPLAADES